MLKFKYPAKFVFAFSKKDINHNDVYDHNFDKKII